MEGGGGMVVTMVTAEAGGGEGCGSDRKTGRRVSERNCYCEVKDTSCFSKLE